MGKMLAEVLQGHLASRRWSFERLAEAADLPRNTVYRWTRGEVKRVRHWQDLARAAHVLALTRSQANALLDVGGHASIDELLKRVTDEEDRQLLAHWSATCPSTLPAQLTSFVGRRDELAHIARLLPANRLVTLTGPGGAGKTRLALEAAQAAVHEFEAVCFVDLSPVRDPDLVIATIAQALDLEESSGVAPVPALAAHLRERKALLLLDNFEQVIDAAPLVTALLQASPATTALVTSRSRLNVRGEQDVPVLPLSLPNPCAGFAELSLDAAVALFADRARAVDPTFTLTRHNAPLVAAVCARLDGLPLGIELAAARTRQVRLEAMVDRSPGRLVLASGGPRDVSDRQRALQATIAWSHALLDPETQRLFRYLGVFAGSFTEDAAASVADAVGPLQTGVPEGLDTLVDQNLLKRTWGVDHTPRYEMLETIREYALNELDAHGELETARSAATGWYLALVEGADLKGKGQACWLRRLAAEHGNLQAALGWCRENGRIETGVRLTIALMPLWLLRDHHTEARAWLEAFSATPDGLPPTLRARARLWHGLLLMRLAGDDTGASRSFAEALSLFRTEGDLGGMSETLQAEAEALRKRGAFALANQRYAESLALAEQAGSASLAAHGYMGLAFCAQEEGRFDAAQRNWELTLEWARRADNRATESLALNSLGEMARYREDWDGARHYYMATMHQAQDLGSDYCKALAMHNLGYVALNRGAPAEAAGLFTEALLLYKHRRYRQGVAECLAGLGRVDMLGGRPERSARLCGAAAAILEDLGTRLDILDRLDNERTVDSLKAQLGNRLESILAEGASMSLQAAVEYAVAAPRQGLS